jgi:hypothetical protein
MKLEISRQPPVRSLQNNSAFESGSYRSHPVIDQRQNSQLLNRQFSLVALISADSGEWPMAARFQRRRNLTMLEVLVVASKLLKSIFTRLISPK